MTLEDGMRKEFSSAKLYWVAIVLLQLLAVLLAGAAAVTTDASLMVAIGLGVLLVPFGSFIFRELASAHFSLGERFRRLLVLQEGLGRVPSDADQLDLHADATILPSLDPMPVGSYFDSPLPVGSRRLAHIVEEASFFTWKVSRLAATVFGTLCVLGLLITFVLLVLALQVAGPLPATPQQLAKIASVVFAFFAAGSFATLGRSFGALSRASESTFRRCDLLRQHAEPQVLDVLQAMAGYDIALGKTPPVPTIFYRLKRARLNAAWKQHMVARPAAQLPAAPVSPATSRQSASDPTVVR